MPIYAILPRPDEKYGKEWMTGGFAKMQEKKEQLEKVRRAFRDPNLQGWIPNDLLTILEQGENTEDILSQMEHFSTMLLTSLPV